MNSRSFFPDLSIWIAVVLLAPCGRTSTAAAPALARTAQTAPADPEAIRLAEELVSQAPPKELTLSAVLKVWDVDGHKSETPILYRVHRADATWQSIYETRPNTPQASERLVITHRGPAPNEYALHRVSGSVTNALHFQGNEAAVPFTRSDFWLSDLGLEFLHWPQQRLVRDAKITMRLGRPCRVLESINPQARAGQYSRVVSWIDAEFGGVIRAEAYDAKGKRLKTFFLKGFKKVNGRWQVKNMEIQNEQSDSRTVLEFTFQED